MIQSFISQSLEKLLQELTMEEKNRISHRGKALEAMKQALKEEVAEK